MKINKGPIEEILDGLEEQSSALSKDELKAELADAGIDIDDLLTQTKALVHQHLKAERTAWMKTAEQNKTFLNSATSCITSWLDRSEEEIRAAFSALGGSGGPAVAFRNQGDLTVEDMARILQQHEELKKRPDAEADKPNRETSA
jgi:hypothetical protein